MKNLPEFQGNLLAQDLKINLLRGNLGQTIDEKIHKTYENSGVLSKIRYSHGVVKGSNPYYVAAVNEIVSPEGLRVATPADIERLWKVQESNRKSILNMDKKCFYADTALVLRGEEDYNSYLAKNLLKQIKLREDAKDVKFPMMIPLAGLELSEDRESKHGLSFKLQSNSEIIFDDILNKEDSFFESEDVNETTGLPKRIGSSGSRTLVTVNVFGDYEQICSGLFRMYHNLCNRFIFSAERDLSHSVYRTGRVMLVEEK